MTNKKLYLESQTIFLKEGVSITINDIQRNYEATEKIYKKSIEKAKNDLIKARKLNNKFKVYLESSEDYFRNKAYALIVSKMRSHAISIVKFILVSQFLSVPIAILADVISMNIDQNYTKSIASKYINLLKKCVSETDKIINDLEK